MATNGVNHDDYTAAAQQAEKQNKDLAKDEVGWYFVEQYYTTLGKSPEKIHVSIICHQGLITSAMANLFKSFSMARTLSSSTVVRPRLPL